jgi:hypothetical protein
MSLLHARNVMVNDQCIIGMRGAAVECKSRMHIRVVKQKH